MCKNLTDVGQKIYRLNSHSMSLSYVNLPDVVLCFTAFQKKKSRLGNLPTYKSQFSDSNFPWTSVLDLCVMIKSFTLFGRVVVAL